MHSTQTIKQNNLSVAMRMIPYHSIRIDELPYGVRLINAAADITVRDLVDIQNTTLASGPFLAGIPSLKIRLALALTLFPYRLIPIEVNWLYNVMGLKTTTDLATALGICDYVLLDWMSGKTSYISISVERVFRLIVYNTLVKQHYPHLKIPEVLLTCAFAARPKTTLPIVIATPAARYYDLSFDAETSSIDDKTDWMINISIDPDINIPIPDDIAMTAKTTSSPVAPDNNDPPPESAPVKEKRSSKPSRVKPTAPAVQSPTTKKKIAAPVVTKASKKVKTPQKPNTSVKKAVKQRQFWQKD